MRSIAACWGGELHLILVPSDVDGLRALARLHRSHAAITQARPDISCRLVQRRRDGRGVSQYYGDIALS